MVECCKHAVIGWPVRWLSTLLLCLTSILLTASSATHSGGSVYSSNCSFHVIVAFDGYYKTGRRLEAINEALMVENGSFAVNVLPHRFPHFWNDFDTLEVTCDALESLPFILTAHPRIISVVADRRITSGLLSKPWPGQRRLLFRRASRQITKLLGAAQLWEKGYRGQGVKVAIFDTGLPLNHPHFSNVVERTDWTSEDTSDDGLGHGTFVAGVIASNHHECLGFAPEAQLHIFKVFTNKQVSYTSWFLDAFNYAIMRGVDIVNLSIGGPDFTDQPFIDKVWELTANGVLLVSAIGNDGPLYGTLNNPADQMDVIGVGGINYDNQMARFSSRGMTTWELPGGYGRVKPDLVTYGSSVVGSGVRENCRSLSGTSVASPVVAGALALLLSTVEKREMVNPSVAKQVLIGSAVRLESAANMFEQGAGKMDLMGAYRLLSRYKPAITLQPPYIDLTECPYFWPYCAQPVYAGGVPTIINVTIINGVAVSGSVEQAFWEPFVEERGDVLRVAFEWSTELWPWAGWVAVALSVADTAAAAAFDGLVGGRVRLTVRSNGADFHLTLPLRARIIPTPPRSKRILWDQFRNLRYPAGYFPRDNLRWKDDPLDWNGDHPHTNFRALFQHLRSDGYYLEVLGEPLTCFNASNYAHLMIVDPEEEFFPVEVAKISEDVRSGNLNLIILADWFNATVMHKIRFFDDNTKQWWEPLTGGANVPALNDLLRPFQIALGGAVIEGDVSFGDERVLKLASSSTIVSAPADSVRLEGSFKDQGADVLGGSAPMVHNQTILLMHRTRPAPASGGTVTVFGDSNCFDSARLERDCFWLIDLILDYGSSGRLPENLKHHFHTGMPTAPQQPPAPPRRVYSVDFARHSKVVQRFNQSGPTTFRSLPACSSWRWVRPQPISNVSSPSNFYHHLKLLQATGSELVVPAAPTERSVDAPPPPTVRVLSRLVATGWSQYNVLLWAAAVVVVVLILRLVTGRERRLRRFFRRCNRCFRNDR